MNLQFISSPGGRPAELMGWRSVRRPSTFSFKRLLQPNLVGSISREGDSDLFKSRGWPFRGPFKGQKSGNFDKSLKIFVYFNNAYPYTLL